MSFPSKSDREKCWASRDELWKCLDENKESPDVCTKFREMYENSCPKQWVKHFDRKREYLKFKDRIQNEGNRSLNSCNSLNAVADDEEGSGGRRLIELETFQQPTIGGIVTSQPEITLDGTSHSSSNHLSIRNEGCDSSSTSSKNPKLPSPRIFRKFQPPTFT